MENDTRKPYAASIEWIRYKDSHRIGPPNPIMVRHTSHLPWNGVKSEGKAVACIKPMYGPYDDLRSVVEFMAFYHIMVSTGILTTSWHRLRDKIRNYSFWI